MRKEALFRAVGNIRERCAADRFPIDSRELVMRACRNPEIEIIHFSDARIGGLLCREKNVTRVALNALHSGARRNFFCAHELIHYCLHGDRAKMWVCGDPSGGGVIAGADAYAEWQANAGAAELLMPYARVIPEFADALSVRRPFFREQHLRDMYESMARKYFVSGTVMEYRVNELIYETIQYVSGTPIEQVTLMSRREQSKRGVGRYSPLSVYDRIHNADTSAMNL